MKNIHWNLRKKIYGIVFGNPNPTQHYFIMYIIFYFLFKRISLFLFYLLL